MTDSTGGPRGSGRGPLATATSRHSRGHYVARSVYGAIIVLALLLTLQDHPPGPWKSALLVTITLVSVLLAETYSDLLGIEIDLGRPTTLEERRDRLLDLAAMLVAAAPSLLLFVLAGLGAVDERRAFRWAVVLTVAWLFVAGFLARRLGGRSVWSSVRSALVIGGAGLVIAFVKQFAHG